MSENKPSNRRKLIFKLIATFFLILWGVLVGVGILINARDGIQNVSWIGHGMLAVSTGLLIYVWWPRKEKET